MKCDAAMLAAYVFGELDEPQCKSVEAHLETCEACSQRLARLRNAVTLLELAPEGQDEPVDMEKLRTAIALRPPAAARFTRIRGWMMPARRWAVALAAGACLAVLCFRYGVALRIGQFEIALGGERPSAPAATRAAAFDEAVVRQIAYQEIAREVIPTLAGLARQMNDLDAAQRAEMVALREDIARQRAVDQSEVRRNIRFIADSMSEAIALTPVASWGPGGW